MSINTNELIDTVLATGCEFEAARNISDHDEVKEILQEYSGTWIVLPKRFPWHVGFMDVPDESRLAIKIETISGRRYCDEWHICGMYTDVLIHEDFTLELAAVYDNRRSDKIPENGIELKATLVGLLEKVSKASKELNTTRIRSCTEEFEV